MHDCVAQEISEIKTDLKELKENFDDFRTDVKVTLAKYSVGVAIAVFLINLLFKYSSKL